MALRAANLLAWLIGLSSVALLAYAGYTAWEASRPADLSVEIPDLVVETANVGSPTAVEYTVINNGPDSVRVLGGDAHCFANCCFGPKLDTLPTIPPGGRAAIPYELFVHRAGEKFDAESTLFLYWRGRLEKIKVTVTGTVSASSATKAAQRP